MSWLLTIAQQERSDKTRGHQQRYEGRHCVVKKYL
jgi:hypothetical protein